MTLLCPGCQETIPIDEVSPPSDLECLSCGTKLSLAMGETVTITREGEGKTVVYVQSGSANQAKDDQTVSERRFGDYELLDEIARGGMGVVYQARQTKLNRMVALKMIRSGELAGQDEIQRFHTEAEAAAQLDHPNIVPIYEVGEQNGQHFFSMGLVNGTGLDARLKDGPLPPREAAELIRTIALAVQYAHDKSIVHRDLKPANVLIDADGKPRITDFGLAKNIAGDSGMTATGQVMGTPSYMPPEQAAGKTEEIGPLADVYSLGAMLYALLTGRPPFQAASVMETLKQVLEQEPLPPRGLNPAVDRDLETICLKCLNKDAKQRYATANELADELERFLAQRPIKARPVSQIARGWRWCRRNRTLASVGSVALCLLLTLAIGGPLAALRQSQLRQEADDNFTEAESQRRRADQQVVEVKKVNRELDNALTESKAQKRRADRNLDQADAVVQKFFTLIAQEGGPLSHYPGTQPLRTMLLDMGRKYYERLIKDNPNGQLSPRLADANFLLAAILRTQAGKKQESLATSRKALAIAEKLLRESPNNESLQARVASNYTNLAVALTDLGKADDALAAYKKALELNLRLHGDHPHKVSYTVNLALLNKNIGYLRSQARQIEEALDYYRKAIQYCELVERQEPDASESPLAIIEMRARNLQEMAVTYNNMATVVGEKLDVDEAIKCQKQAMKVQDRLIKLQPHKPDYRDGLGMSYHNLAMTFLWKGDKRYKDALAAAERALQIFTEISRQNPSIAQYEFHLGAAQTALSEIYSKMGNLKESRRFFDLSMKTYERVAAKNPTVPEYRQRIALNYRSLAEFQRKNGDSRAALVSYRKALAGFERQMKEQPSNARIRLWIGICAKEIGKILAKEKAGTAVIAAYQRALRAYDWLRKRDSSTIFLTWEAAQLHRLIGDQLSINGHAKDAQTSLETALELGRQAAKLKQPVEGEYEEEIAQTYYLLGRHFRRNKQIQKSIDSFQSSLQAYLPLSKQFPQDLRYRWHLASCHQGIGLAYWSQKKSKEAINSMQTAVGYAQRSLKQKPDDDIQRDFVANLVFTLGKFLLDTGDFDAALSNFSECLKRRQELQKRDPQTWRLHGQLVHIYRCIGDCHAAKRNSEEAIHSYRQRLNVQRKLVAESPKDIRRQMAHALACKEFGIYCQKVRRNIEAASAFSEAADLYRTLLQANPESVFFAGSLGRCLGAAGKAHTQTERLPQAKAAFEESKIVFEKLAKRHPEINGVKLDLAKLYINLGGYFSVAGQQTESLKVSEEGLAFVKQLPPKAAAPSMLRLFNRNLRGNRAIALMALQRYEEALAEWQRAMKLDDGKMTLYFKNKISRTLALIGNHAAAAGLAANALKSVKSSITACDFACNFAIAANVARHDMRVSQSVRNATAQRYEITAVKILKSVARSGYFRTRRGQGFLKFNANLNGLHSRSDFRELAQSVGVNLPAWARKPK